MLNDALASAGLWKLSMARLRYHASSLLGALQQCQVWLPLARASFKVRSVLVLLRPTVQRPCSSRVLLLLLRELILTIVLYES